jgi:hypothetical protein
MFSEDQIKEFQQIFLKELGYEISSEEAFKYASSFIDLLTITYKSKGMRKDNV